MEFQGNEDGHTLLLIEAEPGERTFSDYPNLLKCLETVVNMYEEYRVKCQARSEGDLKEFHIWLDSLHRVEVFIRNQTIARYRQISREELKKSFSERSFEPTSKPTNVPNGRRFAQEASSEESSDNWDE